jgi:hypothetical protein
MVLPNLGNTQTTSDALLICFAYPFIPLMAMPSTKYRMGEKKMIKIGSRPQHWRPSAGGIRSIAES